MSALTRSLRPALLLLLLACAVPPAGARRDDGSSVDDQDAVTIRGIFDFQLPKILLPEALRITVNPQWGDFLHKNVVRIRCGARYAFNENLEGSIEVLPHFDNFGGDGDGGLGVAEYRIGGKYAWKPLFQPIMDTAVGLAVSIPGPGAAPEISLGTTRYSPYVVFSRDLKHGRGLNAFVNIAYEFFDSDPAPGRLAAFRPSRDNLMITPGVVMHRAPWHYTLAANWRTTALAGENRHFFSVMPSVSWEVPTRFTFWSRGRWVAGAGYEAIFYDDGIEHRFTGRLKWDLDWRKAVRGVTEGVRNVGGRVRENLPWGSSNGTNGSERK